MSEKEKVKFGNWLSAAPATMGGLSMIGWMSVVIAVMLMVVCFIFGNFLGGLLALLLGLIFVFLFMFRFGEMDAGRTIAARVLERASQKRRKDTGATQYRTGLFSGLPAGQLWALPGALADIEELNGTDGEGESFTLLHHRSVGKLAATLTCVPDGADLLPQGMLDAQVETFGGWIADLSEDTSIAGATITVESALLSKKPLVQKLEGHVAEWAPAAAKEAHAQATAQLPDFFTDTSVHGTVVWDVKSVGEDLEEATAEVAGKLPYHRDFLYASGGGMPAVGTSEDLARVVQIAYNPHRAIEAATDDLLGHENPMRLSEAGPDYFDDFPTRVAFHDGVASMTAVMVIPPRIHITEKTFKKLFAPATKFLRKRVTVFYRPLSSGEALKKAEQLRRSTRTSASAKSMASAFDENKVQLAKKNESDLVDGAAMQAFSLMVTVTFEPTKKAYREATQKLKNLLESTKLTYRFVDYGVSSAFHATLPLGILPWEYKDIVDTVAEGM
ncbi:hypothetical protein ABH924_004618 [Arthrobacter sp. GAS37]|uniref:SCO6880 family protein n=1 Tax=Arthrobacter sp. GAS37 TaxID=3156261 RepID=UPI0038338D2F